MRVSSCIDQIEIQRDVYGIRTYRTGNSFPIGEGNGFEEESRGDRSKCALVLAHLTRVAVVTRSVENKYRLLINVTGALAVKHGWLRYRRNSIGLA